MCVRIKIVVCARGIDILPANQNYNYICTCNKHLLVSDASPQCLVEGSVRLYLIPLTATQQVPQMTVLIVVLTLQLHLHV